MVKTLFPLQQLRQSNINKEILPVEGFAFPDRTQFVKHEAAVVLVDITPATWVTVLWVSQPPSCPKECLPEILINCFDF